MVTFRRLVQITLTMSIYQQIYPVEHAPDSAPLEYFAGLEGKGAKRISPLFFLFRARACVCVCVFEIEILLNRVT